VTPRERRHALLHFGAARRELTRSLGGREPPLVANEQRGADGGLEGSHATGDGGGRNMQLLGGGAQRAGTHQHQEVLKVRPVHEPSFAHA